MSEDEIDNLDAAMDKVAEDLTPSVAPMSKDDDAPADKQVLIRATDHDKERWKRSADKEQVSMSQWIRDTLNAKAVDILDCNHPTNMRRYYPWAEFCLKCNTRLRG
jgi:predicted HicB family RNase H-like nuclease